LTAAKAVRYLTEGRVRVAEVSHLGIVAAVMGSAPDPYRVTFARLVGWGCDCPARVVECAHVSAVQLVTDPAHLPDPPPPPTIDDPFAGLVGF
jgi:uncharacterized Zn finger protein